MDENRYSLAGWAAIVQAILFPLALGISVVQGLIGLRVFHYRGPTLGPSDLLFIVFTVLGIYVLYMFRKLLNELYNYHEIDLLITISIWWGIIFQISSLALRGMIILLWPVSKMALTLTYFSFMTIAMVVIGIVDILIAVKLLKVKDTLSDLLKAFAYLTIIAGILEVSIVFSPLAFLLVPVSCVILGMILLRGKEEVEFV